MPTELQENECLSWWVFAKYPDGEEEFAQVNDLENFLPRDLNDFNSSDRLTLRTKKWSTEGKVQRYKVHVIRMAESKEELEESLKHKRAKFPVLNPRESDVLTSESEVERRKKFSKHQPPAKVEAKKKKAYDNDMANFLQAASLLDSTKRKSDGAKAKSSSSTKPCPKSIKQLSYSKPSCSKLQSQNENENQIEPLQNRGVCQSSLSLTSPEPLTSSSIQTINSPASKSLFVSSILSKSVALAPAPNFSATNDPTKDEIIAQLQKKIDMLERKRSAPDDILSKLDRIEEKLAKLDQVEKKLKKLDHLEQKVSDIDLYLQNNSSVRSRETSASSLSMPVKKVGDKYDLGDGVLCTAAGWQEMQTTGDLQSWCTALLLGVFGNEAANYRKVPRKDGALAYPENFKAAARAHYREYLIRQGHKPPFAKREIEKVFGVMGRKARDQAGRRNKRPEEKRSEVAQHIEAYLLDPVSGELIPLNQGPGSNTNIVNTNIHHQQNSGDEDHTDEIENSENENSD